MLDQILLILMDHRQLGLVLLRRKKIDRSCWKGEGT